MDWNKLNIEKFLKINNEFKKAADEDEKILRAAAVLNDITYEEIMNLPLSKTRSMIEDTGFLYNQPKIGKIKKEYVYGDMVLVPNYKYDKMTTAQYIDYQSIASVADEHLVDFMSIILVPKGFTYNNGYDNEEVKAAIKEHMTMEEAFTLSDFFVKRYVKSMKRMMAYSEATLTTQKILTRDKAQKRLIATAEKAVHQLRQALDSMCG